MAVKRDDERDAGPPPGTWLPTTSYVVLGLLSFGQRLTGYELRQWALESTRFFWAAPAMSQIYRELDRLESGGLVDRRDESGDHERARTTFGLTDDGVVELRRWVDDAPAEEPVIRHPAAFRLFLGHVADRHKLIERLTAHRSWLDSLLGDLTSVREDLAAAESTDGDDRFRYPAIVASWGLDFFGAERAATDRAIDRVESVSSDRRPSAGGAEAAASSGV
ncbi:MAG: PadR family transcriptional regulator [Actinomycetota bacterium]